MAIANTISITTINPRYQRTQRMTDDHEAYLNVQWNRNNRNKKYNCPTKPTIITPDIATSTYQTAIAPIKILLVKDDPSVIPNCTYSRLFVPLTLTLAPLAQLISMLMPSSLVQYQMLI